MDSSKLMFSIPISLFILVINLCTVPMLGNCFDRIINFGDSISDTGNAYISSGNASTSIGTLPYGMTYFQKPTGRWTNGRVIIDFVAEHFNLPFVQPSVGGKTPEYFKKGVNFAVGGAGVLNNSEFTRMSGINPAQADNSLWVQLQSFNKLLPLIANGSDVSAMMKKSLIFVGEIGGNDYNRGLASLVPLEKITTWVPHVVSAIGSAVNDLINLGATTLVVPGNFPIGCAPVYLMQYETNKPEDYDPKTGCINRLNNFSIHHNTLLQEEIKKQRQLHPKAKIIYADYYGALLNVYQHAKDLGFKTPLQACCGYEGSKYHFSYAHGCGDKQSSVCVDPSKALSWDGIHLTEASYHAIANGILSGTYSDPPLSKLC
ncbi:GDSL esterase/lipase At2g27360-like [Carex rostrata]